MTRGIRNFWLLDQGQEKESVWAQPQYAVVWAWKSKKYRIINTIFPYIPKCFVHSSNTDTWTRKRIVEWFVDIPSSFLFCSIQYLLMSMLRYLFWTLQSTAFRVGHIGSRLPSAFAGYTTYYHYYHCCCHCFMFYSIFYILWIFKKKGRREVVVLWRQKKTWWCCRLVLSENLRV
jgi:hypothetical protein